MSQDNKNEQEQDDYPEQYSPTYLHQQISLQNIEVLELQDVKKKIKTTIELIMEKCFVGQDNAIELLQILQLER